MLAVLITLSLTASVLRAVGIHADDGLCFMECDGLDREIVTGVPTFLGLMEAAVPLTVGEGMGGLFAFALVETARRARSGSGPRRGASEHRVGRAVGGPSGLKGGSAFRRARPGHLPAGLTIRSLEMHAPPSPHGTPT